MEKTNTTWADKVKEYQAQDKSTLSPDHKNEYKEYFKTCKKTVHDTLEFVDFRYNLYEERWQQLLHFKDFQEKNFHEIPNLASLNDEEITDQLLTRAVNDQQAFTNLLNDLADKINHSDSILKLCQNLGVEASFYYPLNMMKKFIYDELFNTEKVILKIGPLKTKDRGLQKVIETKDKTIALLDTLRATILCKDPVIPLLIIKYLHQTGRLTRVKNKTAPAEEYKCIHINFGLGQDHRTIYELQIVFSEYYDLQKKDHDYYELIRVM